MSSTTVLILSIMAATIPTFIYFIFIYWVDRYEKEPLWLLISAFLWGAVPSILIAYLFNSVLSIPIYLLAGEAVGEGLAASFIAPPVEESAKGIALLGILFFWRHEIDSILDGIIYGALVGMGFAMVENVYYFVNVFSESGTEAWQVNIFMRAVVFGLNHSLFTSMTGLGIAIARMTQNQALKWIAPVAGWMMAMFLHFIHNATVSLGNLLCLVALTSDWGGVWVMLAIMIWALVQEKKWIQQYLTDEVALGILSAEQYKIACSGRKRFWFNLNQLLENGPTAYFRSVRFFHRCSELAYKKHHITLFENDEKSKELAEKLRNEIMDLGRDYNNK